MAAAASNRESPAQPPPDPSPGPPPEPALSVRSHGLSHPGRVRENNEDVFVVGELVRTLVVRHTNFPQPKAEFSCHRGYVFLVADGVGGHQAGEIASRLSATSVEGFLLNTLRRFTNFTAGDEQSAARELQTALRQADARLFDEAARHPEWSGMGTTLTMAFVVGTRLFVAHAGDSRCYLMSDGALRQLTLDHTVAAELGRGGLITREEQDRHPWRHVVTNLLGGSSPGVRVEIHCLDLHPGDRLLLCSDGLTEMVPDETIAVILGTEARPEGACERLVAEANRLGGKDNVTAIVAHFEGEPAG